MNIPRDSKFTVGIKYGGLKNRILTVSNSARRFPSTETNVSNMDEVYSEVLTTISEIESDTTKVVEKFTQPLFVVFNFFKLKRNILEEIIGKYIAGEVTQSIENTYVFFQSAYSNPIHRLISLVTLYCITAIYCLTFGTQLGLY